MLELEFNLCKIYEHRLHLNQTCKNDSKHCWKHAYKKYEIDNVMNELNKWKADMQIVHKDYYDDLKEEEL